MFPKSARRVRVDLANRLNLAVRLDSSVRFFLATSGREHLVVLKCAWGIRVDLIVRSDLAVRLRPLDSMFSAR